MKSTRSSCQRFVAAAALAALVLWAFPDGISAAETRRTENVILISLDGVRVQEMFGGLDVEAVKLQLKPETPVEQSPLYQKYWAPTPEERRRKIMPFFWDVLMRQHGSIAGNRSKGSTVQVTNRHRFSYPGYSEILTGQARDSVIKSNDKIQNPFPTVLEFTKQELHLSSNQVALFGSWDVFDFIGENQRGAVTINSGFEAYDHPFAEVQLLNRLQLETRTPWDSVRHDTYTFRFAMAHLATYEPRVLYLALGETDDWAHDKRYDRVLQTLELTDRFLRQLWEFLQNHPRYRDKTSLLMSTDHGRGDNFANWPHHNAQTEGAQYIWLAVISPDCSLRGEWTNSETLYQNQIAATLCRFLGLDFNQKFPSAGKPVERLFAK